uniref:caspase family protein n=1 Tax=Accumulibacter sp. TaxID=2053492 RepID=UPI00258D0058
MRRIFLIATSLIFALAAAGNALAAAERRIALVIGNNDYQNVTKLEKAVNDANSVARELKKIGFEVMAYNNVGQKKMNLAVNEFVQKISGGGIGIFFFAGHGLQVNNQNFLVPVEMDSTRSENDL